MIELKVELYFFDPLLGCVDVSVSVSGKTIYGQGRTGSDTTMTHSSDRRDISHSFLLA